MKLKFDFWVRSISKKFIDLKPPINRRQERPTHDMADVLLSLKNAVLKPSPEPHTYHQSSSQSLQNYSNNSNISYSMHHPQMLLSPTHHHTHIHHHHHQNQAQNLASGGYYDTPACAGQHYPSMSVNVSMNMTMHGGSVEGPMVNNCTVLQVVPFAFPHFKNYVDFINKFQ